VRDGSVLALPVKRGAACAMGDEHPVMEDPFDGVAEHSPGENEDVDSGTGGAADLDRLEGDKGASVDDDCSVDPTGDGSCGDVEKDGKEMEDSGDEGNDGADTAAAVADGGEVSAAGVDKGVTGMIVIVTTGVTVEVVSVLKPSPSNSVRNGVDTADWATPSVTVIVKASTREDSRVDTTVDRLSGKGLFISTVLGWLGLAYNALTRRVRVLSLKMPASSL
jgi:hypothetical protein